MITNLCIFGHGGVLPLDLVIVCDSSTYRRYQVTAGIFRLNKDREKENVLTTC